MTECPHCGWRIVYMIIEKPAVAKYELSRGISDGMLTTATPTEGTFEDGKPFHITCPRCNERLCEDDMALAQNVIARIGQDAELRPRFDRSMYWTYDGSSTRGGAEGGLSPYLSNPFEVLLEPEPEPDDSEEDEV